MNAESLKLETLRLVKLDHIIENVAEDGYKSLRKALDEENEGVEKNKAILKSLHETKQKLFRLDVLLQWSHKAAASLQCKKVLDVCRQDGEGLVNSADQLAYLHSELLHSRMPLFDVSLSQRMLLEHRFDILPKIIWSELQLPYSMSIEDGGLSKAEALRRIYFLSKIKLVHDKIPMGMRVSCDRKLGVVKVESVLGQYQAEFGLVPGPSPSVVLKKWSNDDGKKVLEEVSDNDTTLFWRWRLISCKVLPQIRPNPVSLGTMDIIRQNVEDRMWVSSDYQLLKRFNAQNSLKFANPSSLSEDQRDSEMQVPDWIESPFYALDSILRQISGKIAVGILFLDAAKKLINSTWKGCLKFGKLPDSDGLRLEFWNGNYMLSQSDLQRLKGDILNHFSESEESPPENSGVTFDIKVSKSGVITTNQFPNVASSIAPEDLCLANMDGVVDLNSVILKAARRFALLQLQAVEFIINKELEKLDSAFSENSDVVLVPGNSDSRSVDWHESPRLNLRTGLETILTLKVHLKTGAPIISGGFFVSEDGVYHKRAIEKIKIAQTKLQAELLDLSKRLAVKSGPKCLEYCKIISDKIVLLWIEVVSGIFIAHKLNNTPFDSLEICKMPNEISMPKNEHFECYKLLEDTSSHEKNKETRQKSSLNGYILVGMSLGAMKLEKVLLCILAELTVPGATLAANTDVTVKEVPYISEIVNRDDFTKASGAQKRSRSDDVLKSFQVRQELPKDTWDCLNQIISWSKSALLEENAIVQFQRDYIKFSRVESSNQLEFNVKVSVNTLNLPDAFASNEIQMNILIGEALTKFRTQNQWLSQWPESLTLNPISLNLLKQRSSYRLADAAASVVARDNCCVFEYKGFPDNVVERCIRSIERVISLQGFALTLLSNVLDESLNYTLKASSNFIVSLDSLSLDNIIFKCMRNKVVDGDEFEAKCTIISQEQEYIYQVDQNARASNVSAWSIALSSSCPLWIKSYIAEMVQYALSSTSESTTITSLLEGMGALLYIGNSLETKVFNAKDLSDCALYKNGMKIERSEVHCDKTESKYYATFKMTLNQAARGMTLTAKASLTDSSLVCSPVPHGIKGDSYVWFLELWDMMAMETECKIAKTYKEHLPIITADHADIDNLVHLLHECCFSIAGLR